MKKAIIISIKGLNLSKMKKMLSIDRKTLGSNTFKRNIKVT